MCELGFGDVEKFSHATYVDILAVPLLPSFYITHNTVMTRNIQQRSAPFNK